MCYWCLLTELMLFGFISLLLNVFQGLISQICIPTHLESSMLPCRKHTESKSHEKYFPQAINNGRRLFSAESGSDHCSGQVLQHALFKKMFICSAPCWCWPMNVALHINSRNVYAHYCTFYAPFTYLYLFLMGKYNNETPDDAHPFKRWLI